MSKTKIFISSTYYDLSQVRENLKDCIEGLGHEPILSEFDSFPVIPDVNTIDNCKRNVYNEADILVLIIGGKRGSLDPESKISITNLEYNTSKDKGIDSFVFVKKSILDILPMWENNPGSDFSSHVDDTKLFEFIKNIKNEQKWIFKFESSNDIINILKNQLSHFLKYLIDQKNEGKLKPLIELNNESARAQSIAKDKPDLWEYLLTIELFESKLEKIKNKQKNYNAGHIFSKAKSLDLLAYLNYLKDRFVDFESLVNILKHNIEVTLPDSWGSNGQSGDPIVIRDSIDNIINICDNILDFEIEFSSTYPPDKMSSIKAKLTGLALSFIEQIEKIPKEMSKPLERANPSGTYKIDLVLKMPDSYLELTEHVEEIIKNIDKYI